MFKIKTINAIAPIGLQQFPPNRYKIGTEIDTPHAILVRSQSLHDLDFPSSLNVIGRAGAGTNNIPVTTLTQKGIPVLNTPGANANAVRELVIAGMLLASRNICQAWNYVNQLTGNDTDLHHEIEQNKKQFAGFELMGKTLGVIGLGSVGVKVANAAIHLGMQVIGYDPSISVNRAWELSSNVQQAKHLSDLLAKADFISIHVPLLPETKHIINQSSLKQMKKNVVLLNFSRDEIVDSQALSSALTEEKLFCYVTDFPSTSLKNNPRVISLPHLGASTKEAEENCAVMVAQQIRDFLENGSITNSVNFPHVELPALTCGRRLTIVNANIPNMVAQISAKLAERQLNIMSLVNKSRDDIAYTVIDINNVIDDSILKAISTIEGVIQIRILSPSQN